MWSESHIAGHVLITRMVYYRRGQNAVMEKQLNLFQKMHDETSTITLLARTNTFNDFSIGFYMLFSYVRICIIVMFDL